MRPLPAHEIRTRYLRFFEQRGHQRMPSDSLVPQNDPTLLFTGAGMNQFKDMFLGKGSLPWKRITTAQKCLRVPDLERVGQTPRHHTFFEMLGNFSFGDYFKKECIAWEWEFFSVELGIPTERMVVTVYEQDDEAYEIWHKQIGLPREKIYRFGEKENFWPSEAPSKGPNGPCGPCSEIYFDGAPGQPLPAHEGLRELPDDRFTEIGNCVFTQFDRQADGSLPSLPQKNIDVGLGLERITAVLAGARNNFETDLFLPYLEDLSRRTGKRYGQDAADDVRMRRIADHLRAVTFCIADGALPSNEGRGYVVRKILRRAARDGIELGIEKPFLYEMVELVSKVMGDAYPEVREHRGQCRALLKSEEEGFVHVYAQGMRRLLDLLEKVPPAGRGQVRVLPNSGEVAFELHDTFGFPVDITRQVLLERGFVLDEPGFEAAMTKQRERARAAAKTEDAVFVANAGTKLKETKIQATQFTGYDRLRDTATVVALIGAEDTLMREVRAGQEALLVADHTPFYAQGGGQVGDRGVILSGGGAAGPAELARASALASSADSARASALAQVLGVTALEGYHLHRIKVERGVFTVGQTIELQVDEPTRRATERNHTATHLLHQALKNIVGKHVNQAGSEVAPERLRFDYTHGEKLTEAQIFAIEDEVNREIMAATPVTPSLAKLDEARQAGFVMLFGEKYGDQVRTLALGEYSKELCGGTHVANSGNIGAFRITVETAISAGTRRIEAVTGQAALELARRERRLVADLARTLKVQPQELAARAETLLEEQRRLKKELEQATAADLGQELVRLKQAVVAVGGRNTVVLQCPNLTAKELQELLTRASQELAPFAGVLLAPGKVEVLVAAAVSKDLIPALKAGDLVKAVTQAMGGGGGGRPELAQGKGSNVDSLASAVELAERLVRS